MKLPHNSLATVLTIAGSDSSSGAGLQADLKTIHALGGYALTVSTAITAQNSLGVSAVYPLEAKIVKAQLEALLSDYQVQAIKIGMLGNLSIVETVIETLQQAQVKHVVLDTVLVSSSGRPLLEADALPVFINELLPLASVITPNLLELNSLLKGNGVKTFVGQASEMEEIALHLANLNVKAAVIKGGHSIEEAATDYLILPSEKKEQPVEIQAYSSPRLKGNNSHGTGCTYASAIATELAKGSALPLAVKKAKDYLFQSLKNADAAQPNYRETTGEINKGRKGGLNHFYNWLK